ncbi:MAG: aspartyl/asparaginyl beta-hydroxylase domain-containing protein [Deltaproteobacteria bacterium]|nr:aspartyl/asparaginyl beta-hydroxylase domain-containing protein [Deltaproteobacteria bacterium]
MELKYFRRLKCDLDVRPIAAEIAAQPDAWFQQTGRQRVRVQAEALAIPLRGLRKSKMVDVERRDVQESRYTSLSRSFPAAREFIEAFAAEVGGRLGRAKIVNLPPGGRVHPHVDRGQYYASRDRYHLVVDSAGCGMSAEDEQVVMRPGELWWFDNKAEHAAWNDTSEARIHLIFDVKPRRSATRQASRSQAPNPARAGGMG